MSFESLIEAYGYPALFLGTLVEGEAAVTIGAFLAHQGYLQMGGVFLAAFLGTFTGAHLAFHAGRQGGMALLEGKPAWLSRVRRVHDLFDRHQVIAILGFRFLYGARTVTPFVIGMSHISVARFAALNAVGSMIWALVIGSAGYAFGRILQSLLSDLRQYEMWVIAAIVLVAVVAWLVSRRTARRAA